MDLSEVLPALLFPLFFIGASAVVYQSFKLRHLKMEVVNRFKALKQEKSMDHHMLSPKYAWLTYRPIPLSHYRTSELILNRLILKIERWGWFKLTLGRLILFGAISLVVTSISTLTTSLLLLIIPVSYLIILGNDIWNIHREPREGNQQWWLQSILLEFQRKLCERNA
jgi:hypothetical protein